MAFSSTSLEIARCRGHEQFYLLRPLDWNAQRLPWIVVRKFTTVHLKMDNMISPWSLSTGSARNLSKLQAQHPHVPCATQDCAPISYSNALRPKTGTQNRFITNYVENVRLVQKSDLGLHYYKNSRLWTMGLHIQKEEKEQSMCSVRTKASTRFVSWYRSRVKLALDRVVISREYITWAQTLCSVRELSP